MRAIFPASLLAAALASPAVAQDAPAGPESSAPIVVTGIRMQDFRDRLAACLARGCPPDQDIDASLALAEALFVNGDLAEARGAIAASLRRNRRHAAAYPEPVSDLFRADARVARHLGRDEAARRSTFDILRSLERGLPQEDHRHFTARFEIAEMLLVRREYDAALNQLDDLRRRAARAGRDDVAALAELRGLWISLIRERRGPARNRLIEYAERTDLPQPFLRVGARMMLARLYRTEGDHARADALIREVAHSDTGRRQLVDAPPYQLLQRETRERGSVASVSTRIPGNFEDKWIDVGFWIQPDGRVQDLEIVRSGGTSDWASPLIDSIRGRTYTASDAGESTYRLERYTYTSGYEQQTGSRMLRRSPDARVEYFDLSQDAEPVGRETPAG